MSSSNYSRSEWASLTIQDRIKAMNTRVPDEEDLDSVQQQQHQEEKEEPKRSSVVDIWRQREGPKSAKKSVSVPWPTNDDDDGEPTPTKPVVVGAPAPAAARSPARPSWKRSTQSAFTTPTTPAAEPDLTILPAKDHGESEKASISRTKSVMDVWTRRELTIADSPMTVPDTSPPKEPETPKRSSVVDLWSKRTKKATTPKSPPRTKSQPTTTTSPPRQQQVKKPVKTWKERQEAAADLVIIQNEDKSPPPAREEPKRSSVVDRYKRLAGETLTSPNVEKISPVVTSPPESAAADGQSVDDEMPSVTNRFGEPEKSSFAAQLRKARGSSPVVVLPDEVSPPQKFGVMNRWKSQHASPSESEAPERSSVVNRWKSQHASPNEPDASIEPSAVTRWKSQQETPGELEAAVEPSAVNRWKSQQETPVSEPQSTAFNPWKSEDSPESASESLNRAFEDAPEEASSEPSVVNRWKSQHVSPSEPETAPEPHRPNTAFNPWKSEQSTNKPAPEEAPSEPSVANRWKPQHASLRTSEQPASEQPSAAFNPWKPEQSTSESAPKESPSFKPKKSSVVANWLKSQDASPSEPESAAESNTRKPQNSPLTSDEPPRSSVVNRWKPPRDQSSSFNAWKAQKSPREQAAGESSTKVSNRWKPPAGGVGRPQLRQMDKLEEGDADAEKVDDSEPSFADGGQSLHPQLRKLKHENVDKEESAEQKSSVFGRYNPGGSFPQLRKVQKPVVAEQQVEEEEEEPAKLAVEPKPSSVVGRYNPSSFSTRKVPESTVAEQSAAEAPALEEPKASSVVGRYNPQGRGSFPSLRKVPRPTATKQQDTEDPAQPAATKSPSVVGRYNPQVSSSFPQLRKVQKPVATEPEADEEPAEPATTPKSSSVLGRYNPQGNSPFPPLRKVQKQVVPDNRDVEQSSQPAEAPKASVAERYNPQGRTSSFPQLRKVPKPDATEEEADEVPPVSSEEPQESSVVNRYNPQASGSFPQLRKVQKPVATEPEADEEPAEPAATPKSSSVLGRYNPQGSGSFSKPRNVRKPIVPEQDAVDEEPNEPGEEPKQPSVVSRYNPHRNSSFPQLRKVPKPTVEKAAVADQVTEQDEESMTSSVVGRYNPRGLRKVLGQDSKPITANQDQTDETVDSKTPSVVDRYLPLEKEAAEADATEQERSEDTTATPYLPKKSSVANRWNPQGKAMDEVTVSSNDSSRPTFASPQLRKVSKRTDTGRKGIVESSALSEEEKPPIVVGRYTPQGNEAFPHLRKALKPVVIKRKSVENLEESVLAVGQRPPAEVVAEKEVLVDESHQSSVTDEGEAHGSQADAAERPTADESSPLGKRHHQDVSGDIAESPGTPKRLSQLRLMSLVDQSTDSISQVTGDISSLEGATPKEERRSVLDQWNPEGTQDTHVHKEPSFTFHEASNTSDSAPAEIVTDTEVLEEKSDNALNDPRGSAPFDEPVATEKETILTMPPRPESRTQEDRPDASVKNDGDETASVGSYGSCGRDRSNHRLKAMEIVNRRRQQQARSRLNTTIECVNTGSFDHSEAKQFPVMESPVAKPAAASQEPSKENTSLTRDERGDTATGNDEETPFHSGTSAFRTNFDSPSSRSVMSDPASGSDRKPKHSQQSRSVRDFLNLDHITTLPGMYSSEAIIHAAPGSPFSVDPAEKHEALGKTDASVETAGSTATGNASPQVGPSSQEQPPDDERETPASPSSAAASAQKIEVEMSSSSPSAKENKTEEVPSSPGSTQENRSEVALPGSPHSDDKSGVATSPRSIHQESKDAMTRTPETLVEDDVEGITSPARSAQESKAEMPQSAARENTFEVVASAEAGKETIVDTEVLVSPSDEMERDAGIDTARTVAGVSAQQDTESIRDVKPADDQPVISPTARTTPRTTPRRRLLWERRRGRQFRGVAKSNTPTTPGAGCFTFSDAAIAGKEKPQPVTENSGKAEMNDKLKGNESLHSPPEKPEAKSAQAQEPAVSEESHMDVVTSPSNIDSPWSCGPMMVPEKEDTFAQDQKALSDTGVSDTLSFFSATSSGFSASGSSTGGLPISPSSLSNRASQVLVRRRRHKLTKQEEKAAAKDLALRVLSQTIKEHPRSGVEEEEEDGAPVEHGINAPSDSETGFFAPVVVSGESGLAGRYNTSSRFIDNVQNMMGMNDAPPYRNMSYGSGSDTTEGSSQIRSVDSASDSEAWISGRMRKSSSSIRRVQSDSSDGRSQNSASVMTGTSQKSDFLVNDSFVSESAQNLEALKSAYEALSLQQIAMDVTDEVSIATNIDLRKVATDISAASESLRSGLNSLGSPSNSKSPARKLQIPDASAGMPPMDEEVAIEVEYVEDSEEEELQSTCDHNSEAESPNTSSIKSKSLDEERFDSGVSPAGEPSQEPLPDSPSDRRRAYV